MNKTLAKIILTGALSIASYTNKPHTEYLYDGMIGSIHVKFEIKKNSDTLENTITAITSNNDTTIYYDCYNNDLKVDKILSLSHKHEYYMLNLKNAPDSTVNLIQTVFDGYLDLIAKANLEKIKIYPTYRKGEDYLTLNTPQ